MKERISLVVLTGAGISADSGLATFRGSDGTWEQHRVEDVATPEAWARDPALVWRFYQMRRRALLDVEPNAAHLALVELARKLEHHGHEFTLVSQNVDNLHRRAGSEVLSMHGSLEWLRCERCSYRVQDLESLDDSPFLPCPSCGAPRLRPDIVWFGEMPLRLDEIDRAVERCTHFLAVGTSGLVYPAAGYLHKARLVGAETIVQALDEPENVSGDDRFVAGRAADVLPELCATWSREWGLD